MNLLEIKNMVMFQTNNDADDLGDFLPYLEDYINEGYDRLCVVYAGEHVTMDSELYLPLTHDKASPELPEWTHRALADYATWLIYRNGNTAKQNRGQQYRASFEEVLRELQGMAEDADGLKAVPGSKVKNFINIPR